MRTNAIQMLPREAVILDQAQGDPGRLSLMLASGEGMLDAGDGAGVFWLVLRGRIEVETREGGFVLGPRDWMALDRETAARARLDAGALVFGVVIDHALQATLQADPVRPVMLLARGRLARGKRGHAVRLWRRHRVLANRGCNAEPGVWKQGSSPEDVLSFLASLQTELMPGISRCPGHSERRKRQVFLRMQRARLCLEGHAGGFLRVAELARRSHFSPWYFTKVFQALYGIGPLQLAGQLRLEHACDLLGATRLPVTEVSAACGFDNPCSFSRAFRARYGITASEHRLRTLRDLSGRRQPSPLVTENVQTRRIGWGLQ